MNSFRFSGSVRVDTCSAETTVPWITRMSSPASSTSGAYDVDPLGRHRGAARHAGVRDLADPLADQVLLDRLLVELLHAPRRLVVGERGDLLVHRLGVLVARPQALEVQAGQAAEPPDLDRRGGRDGRVHGARHHRDREGVRVDLPGDVHVVGVPGAPRGHDRDLVEPVGTPSHLPLADLDLSHAQPPPICRNAHPLPGGRQEPPSHDGITCASDSPDGSGHCRRRG